MEANKISKSDCKELKRKKVPNRTSSSEEKIASSKEPASSSKVSKDKCTGNHYPLKFDDS